MEANKSFKKHMLSIVKEDDNLSVKQREHTCTLAIYFNSRKDFLLRKVTLEILSSIVKINNSLVTGRIFCFLCFSFIRIQQCNRL